MTSDNGLKNVETLINRFGGMRPMARKLDIAVSTIQGWKKRDYIPEDRVEDIVKAAKANRVSLAGYDLPSSANENTAPEKETLNRTNESAAGNNPGTKPADKAVFTRADEFSRPRPQTGAAPSASVTPPRQTYTIDAGKIKREAVRRSVVSTLAILAIVGGMGYFLFADDAKQAVQVAQNQQQMNSRISDLSDKFGSFETTVTEGLNSLSARITDVAAAVGVERDEDGQIILNNNLTMSERLTALESRLRAAGEEIDLGQLMNRFESLTQSVDGQNQMDTAMSDLKAVVTALQGRMGQLDMALEQAKQENTALAKSLENVSGRDLGAAAMLLALTQFRTSMNREEPFSDDLAVLQDLVGSEDPELTAAIDRLAPHAQNGVLTPEGLSKELRTITGDIVVAKLNGEDVSVKDRILTRLGQVLSVDKDGEPLIATEEQKIIAAAQKSLDAGDVQGALRQLNRLEGESAKAAQPFTQKLQGTLAAQNTTELLMQKFLEKMQQPGGVQNLLHDIPAQIQGATGGHVINDPDSGIIILE